MDENKNIEAESFVQTLRLLDQGAVEADCGDQFRALMRDLLNYTRHFGKAKGSFMLKLAIELDEGGVARIKAEATTKAPKVLRPSTTAWVTKDGKLSSKNPKQLELGQIRALPTQPLREEKTK